MHILVITPGFPENENDTSCIPPMQEYFKELKHLFPEFRISVVALHYPYKNGFYSWNGIKIYVCGGKGRKLPFRLFVWLKGFIASLRINREIKINVIHSFWLGESALIGNIISRILKVKHITTFMGQDAKDTNKFLKLLNLEKIFKVTVSQYQSEILSSTGKTKPDKIIPWGIKPFTIEETYREIDILGVGAFIPVKNFKTFLRIIKEIKQKYSGIKVVIIGYGEQSTELKEISKGYNLENNISFKGHIKREEVLSTMMKSKILLHTSFYESFGYVIAEALAAGCYVVCKKVGCAVESEKLFIAEEEKDFLKIIDNILGNKKDYSGLNNFPLDNVVNSYSELYLNLATNRKT